MQSERRAGEGRKTGQRRGLAADAQNDYRRYPHTTWGRHVAEESYCDAQPSCAGQRESRGRGESERRCEVEGGGRRENEANGVGAAEVVRVEQQRGGLARYVEGSSRKMSLSIPSQVEPSGAEQRRPRATVG